MVSSIHLESVLVNELADRIGKARKLYGKDSSYVIGLVTALEWIAEGAEGGESLKRDLLDTLGDSDTEKTAARPVRARANPREGEADRGENEAANTESESLTENTWIKGVVKWFNNDKGYGFISTDSQVDVFVHWRDISSWDRSLTQGDEVEFMVTRTAKGFQAINVMKSGQDKPEGEEEGQVSALADTDADGDADSSEESSDEADLGEESGSGVLSDGERYAGEGSEEGAGDSREDESGL